MPARLQAIACGQAGIEYLAMKVYIYAIKSSKDSRIYVGQTTNVEKRLKQHNDGMTKSTKCYTPWQLLYSDSRVNRIEARKFEKYLKSGGGKKFLKNLRARSSIG